MSPHFKINPENVRRLAPKGLVMRVCPVETQDSAFLVEKVEHLHLVMTSHIV